MRPATTSPPGGLRGGEHRGRDLPVVAERTFSAAAISMTSPGKPVVWDNDVPVPYLGLDFGVAPWAVPTGLVMVDLFPTRAATSCPPRRAGRHSPPSGRRHPRIPLHRGPDDPRGRGRGRRHLHDLAYVVGETCGPDLVNRGRKPPCPRCGRTGPGATCARSRHHHLGRWWSNRSSAGGASPARPTVLPGLALPGRHRGGVGQQRPVLRGRVRRGSRAWSPVPPASAN